MKRSLGLYISKALGGIVVIMSAFAVYGYYQTILKSHSAAPGFDVYHYDDGISVWHSRKFVVLSKDIENNYQSGYLEKGIFSVTKIYSSKGNDTLVVLETLSIADEVVLALNDSLFKAFDLKNGVVFVIKHDGIYQCSDSKILSTSYYIDYFSDYDNSDDYVDVVRVKDISHFDGLPDKTTQPQSGSVGTDSENSSSPDAGIAPNNPE